MGSSSRLVDWKGRPVDTRKHGGVRASIFIYVLVWLCNVANIANSMNIVSYLRGTMNMGVAAASTTSTNFVAAQQMFTIPAAFLADSYVKRYYTVLIFAPVEILGYILLAAQAHAPSLHPPACGPVQANGAACEPVRGANLSLLLLGIYMICVGEGAIRACLPALGGDQFDDADPGERRLEASFFNWYTFAVSLGAFVGLILIVWVENARGWDVGFAVCAATVTLGLVVWAAGLPFYRNQVPTGSPITRILQVLVVTLKKRKLQLPGNLDELNQITSDDAKGHEVLHRTDGLKCLDKAAIDDGKRGPWSLCTVSQIEETKAVVRMIPIFLTSALGYMPAFIILTFSVQQGNTMDMRLGAITVPPATLFVIPTVFQMAILVLYDRFLVPVLRRATGYASGVTHLQRIAVGFAAATLAAAAAALVETARKKAVEEHGLADSPAGVIPMSVFWLTPQYFLLGIVDVTSFVGLLEFFYSEASAGMKSIGSSIFYCMLGLAAALVTLLIELLNRATRRGGAEGGWLDGDNLNRSKLDSFYWLVCVLEIVSFSVYLFFAWRYVYRNDVRVAATEDEKSAPAGDADVI